MTRLIKCSYCRKSTKWEDNPYRPFCSERCKLIDLGNWASEAYRVKGEAAAECDDAPTNPADQNET